MRKKLAVSFCVLVVAVVLIWLRYLNEKSGPTVNSVFPDKPPAKQEDESFSETPPVISQQRTNPTIQSASTNQTKSTYVEKLRGVLEQKNVPVNFFGRVIDQDSNSLASVKIGVRVRHWDISSLGSSIPLQLETDADGSFHVQGVTGDAFEIESLGKTGYELESHTQRSHDAVGGSLSEPVIFKMWSTGIHEQLITGMKSFHLVPDGRVYVIDLAKGAIAESGEGDLRIWIKRPERVVLGQKYDWSCEISAVNGGLLEETNAYSSMYLAPESGYSRSFLHEQKVSNGWGDSTGTRRFYFSLNGGKMYARLSLELSAYYSDRIPSRIYIQYALNSSGSRVLK